MVVVVGVVAGLGGLLDVGHGDAAAVVGHTRVPRQRGRPVASRYCRYVDNIYYLLDIYLHIPYRYLINIE